MRLLSALGALLLLVACASDVAADSDVNLLLNAQVHDPSSERVRLAAEAIVSAQAESAEFEAGDEMRLQLGTAPETTDPLRVDMDSDECGSPPRLTTTSDEGGLEVCLYAGREQYGMSWVCRNRTAIKFEFTSTCVVNSVDAYGAMEREL